MPERNHDRCKEMESLAHTLEPEQHHAEKSGFEEERGQDFIAKQRTQDRRGLIGKDAPVRAELVADHQARDDAHAEGDGKNPQPIFEKGEKHVPLRP